MRILAGSVLALAACGGSSSQWAGKWKQTAGLPAGSYMECTLGGSGHTITGNGVQHREAGSNLTFTVQGTPDPVPGPGGFSVTYSDNTGEGFYFAQPDANHITLQNSQRTVNLVRQ
jgi:hypothetical protein